MALQFSMRVPYPLPALKDKFIISNSFGCPNLPCKRVQPNDYRRTLLFSFKSSRLNASKSVDTFRSAEAKRRRGEAEWSSDSDEDDEPVGNKNDPYLMDDEERREWRRKIKEVMDMNLDVEEVVDTDERKKKIQELMEKYPLVVEEDDPDWPEDADGWGFNLGQFFDNITIKNKPKEEDDDNYDSENEIVWQDDNYIRPIKDIKTAEWEETVFKDISPLIVLVHNRYRRLILHFPFSFNLFPVLPRIFQPLT